MYVVNGSCWGVMMLDSELLFLFCKFVIINDVFNIYMLLGVNLYMKDCIKGKFLKLRYMNIY